MNENAVKPDGSITGGGSGWHRSKIEDYWVCVFKAGVAESKVFSAGADMFRSTPKGISQEGYIK